MSTWAERLLKAIQEKKSLTEIRETTGLTSSELRAAVRTLKSLGIPVLRKGKHYEFANTEAPQIMVKTSSDLLSVAKEVTKTLRFLYGEDVWYLWPRAVVKGNEILLKIGERGLVHALPQHLHVALSRRAKEGLRRRRLPEVVTTLNALLYPREVTVITEEGEIRGRIELVDVQGRAKIADKKISIEEVKDVKL